MSDRFDFIIVGGGSAGAVVASRLSEDPRIRVALLEAGDRPPERELTPAAAASLQRDPATDWMDWAEPGKAGLGLKGGRLRSPRGKMLGGSSGLNYMVWVRGHPQDFDHWAAGGAEGWSYDEVLPAFRRIEDLVPSNEIAIDLEAHGVGGPVGVAVRSPMIPSTRLFVDAAEAAGIPRGDYNGRDRLRAAGVVSAHQINTRHGKRSSTFHAYLEGEVEARPNLEIITGARVSRVLLSEDGATPSATGVEYRDAAGSSHALHARREVILSAGAVGSPHLLMLSGIGPRRELEAADIVCRHELPDVGKHLKDHTLIAMTFPAPGLGVSPGEIARAMDPEDPRRDLAAWNATGSGLMASGWNEASAFFSTGLGADYSHDGQISFMPGGIDADTLANKQNIDIEKLFADVGQVLSLEAENIYLMAQLELPRSEGEVVVRSADPAVPPIIDMNYYADPLDLRVMTAVMRRGLEIVARWPGPNKPGPWLAPPDLARKHGHVAGRPPSDALLENVALHFTTTTYHLCCTCRIGSVVDPRLRVLGVSNLRVADASVMPEIPSGNINAVVIMIGEKAAEIIAQDHGLRARTASAVA
jgi:choline dehydrogenase-like flavoprotein